MSRNRSASLVLVASLIFATLSQVSGAASSMKPSVAIRVDQLGGFIGPNMKTARLPDVVLYGDGRVLARREVAGSVSQMYQSTVKPSTVGLQVAAFLKATKVPVGGWDLPSVADVPTTQIIIYQNGRKSVASIYALGFHSSNLSVAANIARANLSKAILALTKLAGKTSIFNPSTYEVWPLWVVPGASGTGISNPAAQFCLSQRGTLITGKVLLDSQTPSPNLTIEYCHLADGRFVEEWAYFYRASKVAIVWPKGIRPPTGRCMSVNAKPFFPFMHSAATKEWLLPNGQMINLTWRPVLPGERACQR